MSARPKLSWVEREGSHTAQFTLSRYLRNIKHHLYCYVAEQKQAEKIIMSWWHSNLDTIQCTMQLFVSFLFSFSLCFVSGEKVFTKYCHVAMFLLCQKVWLSGRSLTHLKPPRYIGSPKLREVMGAGDLPDTNGSESSWRLPSSPFLITLTLCQVLRVIGLKIDLVRACGLACCCWLRDIDKAMTWNS